LLLDILKNLDKEYPFLLNSEGIGEVHVESNGIFDKFDILFCQSFHFFSGSSRCLDSISKSVIVERGGSNFRGVSGIGGCWI